MILKNLDYEDFDLLFYLAVSCLRALMNVAGWSKSERSNESLSSELLSLFLSHFAIAKARLTRARK